MYHQVVIVGHLGRDPEMRYTPAGKAVTDMSVATSRRYTDASGKTAEETTWWRGTAWEWRAENIHKYLHKGSKVMVVGQLRPDPATGNPRIWTGKDGTPHASYDVTANQVIFLSSRGDDDDTVHGVTPSVQVFTTSNDDIPF